MRFASIPETAVQTAQGDTEKIFAANDAAWRRIFLTACVPGVLFTLAAVLVSESPRWLFRRHRVKEARRILRFTRLEEQAALEIGEMQERSGQSPPGRPPGDLETLPKPLAEKMTDLAW